MSMPRAVVAAVCVGVVCPTTALARNPALDKARIAMDRYDLEAALAFLQRALPASTEPAEQTEILLLTAELELTCNRPAGAQAAFRELLGRFPDFELPANSSPKLVAAFEAVASEQPTPPRRVDPAVPIPDNPVPPAVTTPIEPATPFYRTWWFWTAASVIVAGAIGVATWQIVDTDPPKGDFGVFPMH